jgi:5-methylthioadenosine/S-adenosylhomocysteine deaminase
MMEIVDLIVEYGHVITQNPAGDEYADGVIVVDGNTIRAVGNADELRGHYQPRRTINARGRFIFPGLINTHTHLFQSFLKGFGEGIHVHSWINEVTIPVIRAMDREGFYLSAKAGCLDAIRSGTTTLVEYMYPLPWPSKEDAIFEGMLDSGIRGLLGRGIADIGADDGDIVRDAFFADLLQPVPEVMADCERLYGLCQEKGEGRISFCLAPPYMRCQTPEMLRIMREFSEDHNCLITMHIGETPKDDAVILERHGKHAVEWLEEEGFLGPHLLAVHCVNLVDDAIRLFAEHNVGVSYNPVSNMYLGTGMAPIPELRELGVKIGLATDGPASNNAHDMIEVLKMGVLLQRALRSDPLVFSGREALKMATIEAAETLGLADQIGSLEPGKRADMFIANFQGLKPAPYYDPINSLVFSSDPRVVETVVIDGRVILENGKFTMIDEDAFIHKVINKGHDLVRQIYREDGLRHATAVPKNQEQ